LKNKIHFCRLLYCKVSLPIPTHIVTRISLIYQNLHCIIQSNYLVNCIVKFSFFPSRFCGIVFRPFLYHDKKNHIVLVNVISSNYQITLWSLPYYTFLLNPLTHGGALYDPSPPSLVFLPFTQNTLRQPISENS